MRPGEKGLYGALLKALRKLKEYKHHPDDHFNIKLNYIKRCICTVFFFLVVVSAESPKSLKEAVPWKMFNIFY